MKTFHGFFAKQLFLFLVQLTILSLLFVHSYAKYLETAHQQQADIIRQMVAHHISNDPKLLARELRSAFEFRSLNMDRLDGSRVFTNLVPTPYQAFSAEIFKFYGTLPLHANIENQDLNLKLDFEINLSTELALADRLFALLLLAVTLLSLAQYFMMRWGVNSLLKGISTRLAHAVAGFAANQDSKQDIDFSSLPESFSEVAKAIKTLGTVVDDQIGELQVAAEGPIEHSNLSDPLTGLPGRNRFVQYFEEHLKEEKSPNFGCLAIIRCTELQEINHTRGYQEGDKYVTEVVEMIEKSSANYYSRQLYRLNGIDFALVLPSQPLKEAERFGQNLRARFNEYQKLSEIDSVAYTGLIQYKPGKPLGELLAMADTAISIAQTKQTNAWHAQYEADLSAQKGTSYGTQNWRQVIDEVLGNKRVTLLCQDILSCDSARDCYGEILTRFHTAEGQILPTASFLAMAEKLDKIVDVDRMIIQCLQEWFESTAPQERAFGLNIAARSAQDEKFVDWLEKQLKQQSAFAHAIVFEVPESGLQQNIEASSRFIEMLHRCGARITVERFGVGLASFKFFREFKPDFIKMDGTYTRGIDEDQNNQYFLRLMVDLAHRIDVGVIAEGVETESEKLTLDKLAVDGIQGYFIGKPTPLTATD